MNNKAPRGSISQIILKALNTGNKYGYEICKDIEKITNGKLILKQPSLYSCLRRMEEQGLISSYWEDSDLGGKRHYYCLTDFGKKILDESEENSSLSETELINSLPTNENYDEVKDEKNTEKTTILKQENLFNIAKKDAKNTNENKTETTEESGSSSFLQFDLFNENVSFVKNENLEKKENIPQFKNKYSDLDNHSEEIEPILEVSELENDDTSLDSFKESDNDNKLLDENSIEKINNSNKENINVVENSIKTDNQISWDLKFDSNEGSNNDYKSIIGQLYNNSRLHDPYEQNKYQNFKEMFPTSSYDNSEKSKQFETKEENETTKNINNIIKSSEESNIDCEDIRNLNNLYNLQGIEIKVHSKKENKNSNKVYTDKNRLNMVTSWVVSAIMILEILFSYIILKENKFIINKQKIIFFLSIAFVLSYCLISSLENLFDKYKMIIIEKNFKKIFMRKLFLFIIFVILIFTISIILGMSSLFQAEFFAFWFIPTLLLTNLPISTLIYYILFKSKNFSK